MVLCFDGFTVSFSYLIFLLSPLLSPNISHLFFNLLVPLGVPWLLFFKAGWDFPRSSGLVSAEGSGATVSLPTFRAANLGRSHCVKREGYLPLDHPCFCLLVCLLAVACWG